MSEEWVAACTFVAVHPDGARGTVRVAIGAPRRQDDGDWECAVALDGLHTLGVPVVGVDPLQALGLAWQLLGSLLGGFEARGGRLEWETGGAVPLAAYFGAR